MSCLAEIDLVEVGERGGGKMLATTFRLKQKLRHHGLSQQHGVLFEVDTHVHVAVEQR